MSHFQKSSPNKDGHMSKVEKRNLTDTSFDSNE